MSHELYYVTSFFRRATARFGAAGLGKAWFGSFEKMTHWKKFMGGEYLGAWDFPDGKDVTLTIKSVQEGKLRKPDGKEEKRAVVLFQGTEKKLALNSTNGKAIAGMYGNQVEQWSGKRITLYATETKAFGETVPCVRVRPTAAATSSKHSFADVEREPGSDG